MTHLTKMTVGALTTDDPRGRHVPDDELDGFGVTVFPSGKKSFFVRYSRGRVRRRLYFGVFGPMTVLQAREEAGKLLAQVRLAKVGQAVDPAVSRDKVARTPCWKDWTSTYVKEVTSKKKSATADIRFLGLAETGGDAFRILRDRWGAHLVTDITAADVRAFHDTMAKTPTQANRWLASISACFAEAVRRDHVALNPCTRVARFPERPPRARVLLPEEREPLYAAIDKERDPHARGALRLLCLTGMRVSEVLHARWADIDREALRWRIPSPKAGHPQSIPIWPAVLDVLDDIPKESLFIVKGRKTGMPRRDLKGPWAAALDRAGLADADLTLHDLRRDVGKYLADNFGLHVAMTVLRHSKPDVTQAHYAPTGAAEARRALETRILPFKTTQAS